MGVGFGGGSADDLSTRGKISQPHLLPQVCQEPGDPLTGCERCQSAWIAFGRELDNCFVICFFLLPSEWKTKYIEPIYKVGILWLQTSTEDFIGWWKILGTPRLWMF